METQKKAWQLANKIVRVMEQDIDLDERKQLKILWWALTFLQMELTSRLGMPLDEQREKLYKAMQIVSKGHDVQMPPEPENKWDIH